MCVTTIQKSFDVEIVYKSEEEKTSKMDPLVLRTRTTKSQIISYKRVQSAPFQKRANHIRSHSSGIENLDIFYFFFIRRSTLARASISKL